MANVSGSVNQQPKALQASSLRELGICCLYFGAYHGVAISVAGGF